MYKSHLTIILILITFNIYAQDEKFPLHFAIQNDSTSTALYYISNNNHINEKDKKGFTPLMHAIVMNNEKVIDALIEAGVNVNERNKSDLTTLMQAGTVSNPGVVQKLLKAGAILEADKNGWTALTTACRAGNSDVAIYLIEQGANIFTKTKNNWTPFLFACAYGSDSLIELFITKGVYINETSSDNWTSLMASLFGGNLKSANYFIDNGVDIHFINNQNRNAFLYACEYGDDEIIMKLIDKYADIHLITYGKWSSVMLAIRNGKLKLAGLLISEGVSLKTHDANGWSVMTLAARYGDLELMQLLVEEGFSINMFTENQCTCLMLASIAGNTEMVRYLLEQNAWTRVKALDTKQDAFSFACEYGNVDMVQLFIDHGEKVNKLRNSGIVINTAVNAGNNEVVKLLIENGAIIKPFHMRIAFERNNDELGKYFLNIGILPKEFKGSPDAIYATGKVFMFLAEMNEKTNNNELAKQQFNLAAINFETAEPKLLKKAQFYDKGRSGLLFAVVKLGITILEVAAGSEGGQYKGYSQLIPYGAGEVSPDEAKSIEYEGKADYSHKMAIYCRNKLN